MSTTKHTGVEKSARPRRTPVSNPEAARPASPAELGKYIFAVGRRKEAAARVRLYGAKGAITVNGKTLAVYFPQPKLQATVLAPFTELKIEPYRIEANVGGGGARGQAEALRLGISRALVVFQPEFRARLRTAGLLTRDARVKERRKYGLKKARRAPQWAKR
jgi:small subunit ribosomal protein S9